MTVTTIASCEQPARAALHSALWVLPSLVLVALPGCSPTSSPPSSPPPPMPQPTGGDDDDAKYVDRMAEEHAGDRPIASGAVDPESATTVDTDVRAEAVTYANVGGRPVSGFLARPGRDAYATAATPGIIVIHEWWGLNDNIRAIARQLADAGYVALAVDLFNGEVAQDATRARELTSGVGGREAEIDDNLRQAYRYLSEDQGAPRVGVIGWCFGGAWSLRTALLLPDEIDATVIYYGKLVTDRDKLAPLRMPILGIFGAEDQSIPVATVREFESALHALGKDATIRVYEGANHAFANPSGTRYNAEAARDAWDKTTTFFEDNLKKG
jgi:carboxymethylenebutenolidase